MIQSISSINRTNSINFNGLIQMKPTRKVATEKATKIKETVKNSETLSQMKEKIVSVAKNTAKEIKKFAIKAKNKLKDAFTEKEDLRTPEEIQKEKEEEEKAECLAKLALLGLAVIAAYAYFVLPWIILICKIKSMFK